MSEVAFEWGKGFHCRGVEVRVAGFMDPSLVSLERISICDSDVEAAITRYWNDAVHYVGALVGDD